MTERRSLLEGLKATPAVDPRVEREFVQSGKFPTPSAASPPAAMLGRIPISTRLREDYGKALKRASLERQLEGVTPHSLQDILEEAIGPWLKANGYLP